MSKGVRVRVSPGAPNCEKGMEYTIIEDCSPYYIRFTWQGLPELIDFIKSQPQTGGLTYEVSQYTHCDYAPEVAKSIIERLPMKGDLDFMINRVALFISHPSRKAVIHKDGPNHRISVNMLLEVHDQCCSTHWWADEQLEDYKKYTNPYTRQIADPRPMPTPMKSMVAQPNECVLFNTDMWHAWDNASPHQRILLTLRVNNPGEMYFDDAKRILFGNVAESGLLQQS